MEILKNKLEDELKDSNELNAMSTINAVISAFDEGLQNHMVEVGAMTLFLCKKLELNDIFVDPYYAGYLHDIGKIALPRELIWKPKKLDDNEWDMMREHSFIGASILMSSPDLKPYVEIVLCHHEKPDGSGYPRGIKGKDIPFISKIVSVADMFCAMRSIRPYRIAYSLDDTINHIEQVWKRGFSDDIFSCIKDIICH